MADEVDIEYTEHRTRGMSADAKFIHLESRVDRLEGDVGDIKKMVKQLVDRPQNPGFAQVISTLLATLGTCAIIFGFAEWRIVQAVSPVEKMVEKFSEQTTDNKVKSAILEERSVWLRAQNGWKPD